MGSYFSHSFGFLKKLKIEPLYVLPPFFAFIHSLIGFSIYKDNQKNAFIFYLGTFTTGIIGLGTYLIIQLFNRSKRISTISELCRKQNTHYHKILQTLCCSTSSMIFGSYLMNIYYKKYNPMLFINMLSSSLLFFTGYFPTFSKDEDFVDQVKDIRYISKSLIPKSLEMSNILIENNSEIVLNETQKNKMLIILESKWNLDDIQLQFYEENLDHILKNKMRRKDLKIKNSVISKLKSEIIENEKYNYVFF